MVQVELDMKAVSKIVDDNGDISKENFTKFAIDTKLTDFNITEGVSIHKQNTIKWQQTPSKLNQPMTNSDRKVW